MAGSVENCPVVQQAVGWALHALEPDEELVVAAHIPGCAVCQAAVRETEEVVAGLGAAADQVEPPRELRMSLMAAVAETPQVPAPRRVVPQPPPTAPMPSVPEAKAATPRRVDPGERGRLPASWLSRRKLVVAAMALVAIVAVGGLAVRTAQLDQERAQSSQAISEVLNQLVPPGTKHAVLATADGATVGAVVLDKGERQVLTVGMPANPTDHTYVLWGVAGQSTARRVGYLRRGRPRREQAVRWFGSGQGRIHCVCRLARTRPCRTRRTLERDGGGTAGVTDGPGNSETVANHAPPAPLGFRARIEERPTMRRAWRIGVAVLGAAVLALGIIAIPYPGPGWLIVFAGPRDPRERVRLGEERAALRPRQVRRLDRLARPPEPDHPHPRPRRHRADRRRHPLAAQRLLDGGRLGGPARLDLVAKPVAGVR